MAADKPWQIRDVKPATRHMIRVYAIQHGITTAQALDRLATLAKLIETALK